MSGVLIFAISLGLIILESTLLEMLSVHQWAVQTPLVVSIYLGLDRDFISGACILGALCIPVEWFVGGVFGVYSMGLVGVFLLLQLVRPNLQRVWGLARGIAAGVAALAHAGIVIATLSLLGQGATRLTAAIGWQMWIGALIVAGAAIVIGKGFASLEEKMNPNRSRLEFDPRD